MSDSDKMESLNWIPQVRTNNDSVDNTNRYKPRLATKLTLKYLLCKEDNSKRLMLYLKVLEPDSLNIVNQDMNEKGIVAKNLPFWYNIDDNEYILKVSSQNCKCYENVEFVEGVEYIVKVEFKRYNTKKQMVIHVYYIILLMVIIILIRKFFVLSISYNKIYIYIASTQWSNQIIVVIFMNMLKNTKIYLKINCW